MNRQPRRRARTLITFLIVAVLLTAGLTFLNSEREVPVRTARLQTGIVEEMVAAAAVGSIEPIRRASISAEIHGTVAKILHREGAEVKKDMPLIEINTKDLMAEKELILKEMETTRLRISQAGVRKEKIRQDMARLEPLRKNEIVSQQQYEGLQKEIEIAQKDVEILTASIHQLEAALQQLQLKLDKTSVRAPFDSTVTRLVVEEGETVSPGKILITLTDSAPPLVEAPIDEVDLGKVVLGQPVRVTFDSIPQKTFFGELVEVAPVATSDQKNNRTVRMKAKLTEWHPSLRIGMSAKVIIITQPGKRTDTLPKHVIYPQGYVLVVDRGVARKRYVKIGRENWEVAEILEGLTAQDEIILPIESEEETPIQEGMRVRPVPDVPKNGRK